ncbi:hypothetical protein [Paenibacillus harenae]|uniref:hypothetical protein n=1 Tax=Paenibacillus harenae TaxID=306543 RepID=UPI000410C480|nr:hypothetical protein [Paenibacillus harenae]
MNRTARGAAGDGGGPGAAIGKQTALDARRKSIIRERNNGGLVAAGCRFPYV